MVWIIYQYRLIWNRLITTATTLSDFSNHNFNAVLVDSSLIIKTIEQHIDYLMYLLSSCRWISDVKVKKESKGRGNNN